MSKILYAASSVSHINSFHLPYIEALRDMGHEVLIMASGEGADFNIPFEKKITSRRNFREVKNIRKILDGEAFDTVILNTSLASFFIRLALRKSSRPITVNVVHGYLFPLHAEGLRARIKRKILLAAENLLRKKTDKVVTMNAEDTAIALKYRLGTSVTECRGMGIKPDKAPRDRAKLRAELGMNGKTVIFFAGELSARKNQTFLINLMPKIRAEIPNAELWLAGDGDKLAEQKSLVESLELANCVFHIGRIDNVRDYMAACDLYASAAKIEGLPFNLIEALMQGVKVTASDIKGHRDILGEGAGLLFSPEDECDAIDKILALLRSESTANQEAREEAVHRYEFDEVFYETLIKITTENERNEKWTKP